MTLKNGFTLIELLLSLALMGILLAVAPLTAGIVQEPAQIDFAAQTIMQSLRTAQIRAQAVEQDQPWGVALEQGQVTVFQGTSYLTRTDVYDQTQSIAESVTISGLTEVVYSKMTGEPAAVGAIVLETSHQTRTITLFDTGFFSYE